MPRPSEHRQTVFLHGGWRCASTYVWSRFREQADTTCFYEPFDEALARLCAKRVARNTPQRWESRHPPLALPYRAEYLPLLRPLQRGMPRFRASFALARYFPSEYASAEIAYLARMIERSQGTQPVFGFSRSLARVATLKAGLGGYHIVLRRNPVQQWLSCRSYRSKGLPSYFELCHALILMLAPTHSPARNLARVMGLPRLPWWARRVPRQLQALRAALHPFSDELSYRVFIGVHLLSHAAALPAADLVLDVDRLGTSQSYRARTQTAIATSTGLAVDFDDCHVPVRDTAGIPVDFAASEAHVRRCLLDCGADLEAAQSYEHSRTPVASTVLR